MEVFYLVLCAIPKHPITRKSYFTGGYGNIYKLVRDPTPRTKIGPGEDTNVVVLTLSEEQESL